MKITDTDHIYIFGQTTKIRNALCANDLITMNTEAIRLAMYILQLQNVSDAELRSALMHIQDLIKKQGDVNGKQ